MEKKAVYLEIDDYLDLFIMAGTLNDQEWQQEISVKLQNYLNSKVEKIDVVDCVNDVESIDASNDYYDDHDYDNRLHIFGWIE